MVLQHAPRLAVLPVVAGPLLAAAAACAASPSVRLVEDAAGRPAAVEVHGLTAAQLAPLRTLPPDDPRWPAVLAVFVAGEESGRATGRGVPPILGRCTVERDVLRFTPQFAFRPGLTYRVELRAPGADQGAPLIVHLQTAPPPPSPPTRIVAIYPSASVLPENHLRFYLHFSGPMSAGQAYRHVQLLTEEGQVVSRAFLEIGEELWDGQFTRLTLLFDPGRVKHGLKPREEFGPVLIAGRRYILRVDSRWQDASGRPLAAGFEKHFAAGPAVEAAVDVRRWQITPPPAGSRLPLIVHFDRPLDRALLFRMVTVEGPHGRPVEGQVEVLEGEQTWTLQPAVPWQEGAYALVVDTALEDSAGNNLQRPFEVDVFREVDARPGPEYVRLPWTPAPQAAEEQAPSGR